jgi:p-hydroxybenzoate 3-monooxygenase
VARAAAGAGAGAETQRHHLDFVDHVGRSVWVYGQTEVTKDLMEARQAAGQQAYYEASDVTLLDVDSERPSVTFTDSDGVPQRIEADAVAGCDGFHGPSRTAIPSASRRTWERVYPYAWLGVLADVPPSTDELIYAWHPDGFALHSMRSATVSRLYVQVPPEEDIAGWSDDRIWDALATRLGHGRNGWSLQQGPITEKAVLPMRSFVSTPMRHGRLFLAGDAAHIVPPTGAKGLNLAIADVTLLARALSAWLVDGSRTLVDSYSEDALRRVWRCTHFSWWMTSMLHTVPIEKGGDDFDRQLQLSQLRWVTSSEPGAAGLAENYAGLPIGF